MSPCEDLEARVQAWLAGEPSAATPATGLGPSQAFQQASRAITDEDRRRAAGAFLDFLEALPSSEHVPAALYDAANLPEQQGCVHAALPLYEHFVTAWPGTGAAKGNGLCRIPPLFTGRGGLRPKSGYQSGAHTITWRIRSTPTVFLAELVEFARTQSVESGGPGHRTTGSAQ